jgi:hypothetical protein
MWTPQNAQIAPLVLLDPSPPPSPASRRVVAQVTQLGASLIPCSVFLITPGSSCKLIQINVEMYVLNRKNLSLQR